MPEFIRQSKICMEDALRESFISHIAANPMQGALIVGTGGVRKIRWAVDTNQGKSGGVFVLFIIIIIKRYQFFCLRFMGKVKKRI
ncbi:MAG: hypothetical protein NTW94_02385 [Legionellales bacterium]|nr:hypothetical protein [Legionellales bacterium]